MSTCCKIACKTGRFQAQTALKSGFRLGTPVRIRSSGKRFGALIRALADGFEQEHRRGDRDVQGAHLALDRDRYDRVA